MTPYIEHDRQALHILYMCINFITHPRNKNCFYLSSITKEHFIINLRLSLNERVTDFLKEDIWRNPKTTCVILWKAFNFHYKIDCEPSYSIIRVREGVFILTSYIEPLFAFIHPRGTSATVEYVSLQLMYPQHPSYNKYDTRVWFKWTALYVVLWNPRLHKPSILHANANSVALK